MSSTDQTARVYQLRIWIREISPQIWRRLLVRSDSTIAQLHNTLQIAFGWTDEHLHQFLIRGKPFGIWKPGGISFYDNPHQVQLRDFHFRCKERWIYEYDLTDSWQHELRLEQILPLDPTKRYPVCVAGKRRAPLEDCGGPWAFMALRDEHSLFEVTTRFAQLLLDHRDELDNYQDELRRLNASTPNVRNRPCKTSLKPDARPQEAEARSAISHWKHIAYWIVCEDFDRQAVNHRLAEYATTCHQRRKGGPDAYSDPGHY